jgi:hypothetical protein
MKLVAILLTMLLGISSAQPSKPAAKDIPAAYAKTIDDKNLDAFATLFNDDAVFRGLTPKKSKVT